MSKIWKIQSIATPKRQEHISCYEVHVANLTQSAIPKWDLNVSQPFPKDGFHPLHDRPWQIDGLCVSSEVQATYLHVEFQTWQWTGHQHQIIQFHDFPTYKLPFSLWIFKLAMFNFQTIYFLVTDMAELSSQVQQSCLTGCTQGNSAKRQAPQRSGFRASLRRISTFNRLLSFKQWECLPTMGDKSRQRRIRLDHVDSYFESEFVSRTNI